MSVYNIPSCLQQCKNYKKNPSRFSKVMVTNVLPPFYGSQYIIFHRWCCADGLEQPRWARLRVQCLLGHYPSSFAMSSGVEVVFALGAELYVQPLKCEAPAVKARITSTYPLKYRMRRMLLQWWTLTELLGNKQELSFQQCSRISSTVIYMSTPKMTAYYNYCSGT